MLKCRNIAHHGSDYVDATLTRSQTLGYALHLLVCGHCRRFIRHLRCTIAYARALDKNELLNDNEAEKIAQKATNPNPSHPSD